MYNYHRCESDNIKYYPGGITAKQAQARNRRWYQLFDLSGSFVTALVILFIVFTFLCRAAAPLSARAQINKKLMTKKAYLYLKLQ